MVRRGWATLWRGGEDGRERLGGWGCEGGRRKVFGVEVRMVGRFSRGEVVFFREFLGCGGGF